MRQPRHDRSPETRPCGRPGAIPATVTFKPTVHINYEETVLRIKYGLPKLKDFPAAIGGSGEEMAE